jgi:GNAT superfamily N-acetyltransferase
VTHSSFACWDIEPLSASHQRSDFDCGVPPLNDGLRSLAGQRERRDYARTYVAVETGHCRVLGFYCISSHRVVYEALPPEQSTGLPHIDVPAILLGRLAVDRAVQAQGLGEHLLLDALRRAEHVARSLGVRAVEVHAIDNRARGFYLKYGFVSLHDDRNHLYLPMPLVRKLRLPPLTG